MSKLQMVNILITFLPICACILLGIISLINYIKTKDNYWFFAIMCYVIYLAASFLQLNKDSSLSIQVSTIFFALFYVFIFLTIRKDSKSNTSIGFLFRDKKLFIMLLILFPVFFILSFTIYSYIVINKIGYMPPVLTRPVILISISYPVFDMLFLIYYIMSENIFNIKYTLGVRAFFSLGFLFLLIGDTVYVFETTFNYYVWEMDHISAVVSVTLVSFAIFYTKTNKNTFDYSSLNLLSQENKMIFDYRIMILGIWLIYSFIYVLAVINNNISHKYFLQITIYGMIIFFIILLSNFSIIGYKEVRIIKLHKETIKDFLTGAFSKKHAVNALEYLFAYSKKQGFPISVLMLDIDHFKEYNDTWGHPEGDKILKDIVRIIINEVGEHNMVSRYGGEEFLILLPNVSRNQGIKICERIREKVEQKEFKGEETQPLGKITVSIGGYNICANTKDKNELITKADKALYQAKISRNTCIWYGDS